jgi:mannose-6-phosphate isomerase
MKDKSSIIINEEHNGMTLREFFETHKLFFDNYRSNEYPLLVKLLDCNQDLSVQVHPTEEYTNQHRDAVTKNEAWYILDAKPNASIIYGHHAKTQEELVKLIKANDWSKLLNVVPVKPFDLFYVPSGTVHALKSGLLIYEIQQASDCTYRLYDYGREKTDPSRTLHVTEAIENIAVPFVTPTLNKNKGELLSTPFFSINLINNTSKHTYTYTNAR